MSSEYLGPPADYQYAPTPFHKELFDAHGPIEQGGDWFIYCGAIASMFDQIVEYASDQSDGTPGWGILLDVDRCPDECLIWLGQFVGVTVPPTLVEFPVWGNANLVSNPNAEIDVSGWSAGGSGGPVLSRAAGFGGFTNPGSGSFQLVATSALVAGNQYEAWYDVDISVGQIVAARMQHAPLNFWGYQNAQIRIDWVNAVGAVIGTADGPVQAISTPDVRDLIINGVAAPAGAVKARVYLLMTVTTGMPGSTQNFDNVLVALVDTLGEAPPAYYDGNSSGAKWVGAPNASQSELQIGTTSTPARDWIKNTDGFKRGTPAAMAGAAAHLLSGTQTVYFNERAGDAYHLTVATLASETTDSTAVLAALIAAKPAGLILAYSTVAGDDYNTLTFTHSDYNQVKARYATYADVLANPMA